MPNLHYIRAAIEHGTGIKVSLSETKAALVAEGLLTNEQVNKLVFKGYSEFHPQVIECEEEKEKDILELIEKEDG